MAFDFAISGEDNAPIVVGKMTVFGAWRFFPIPSGAHRRHDCPMTESLRTDLNDFLFSPIANDASGLHLTVLSALARTGVDPWDEAARLAALTRESATQKIVQLLAHVPNGPSPGDETASMAAKLVTQLHSPSTPRLKPVASTRAASPGDESPRLSFSTLPGRVKYTIYLLVVLIVMVIAYLAVVGSQG